VYGCQKKLLHFPYNIQETRSFDWVFCWDIYNFKIISGKTCNMKHTSKNYSEFHLIYISMKLFENYINLYYLGIGDFKYPGTVGMTCRL
jgi:hypothetical protein